MLLPYAAARVVTGAADAWYAPLQGADCRSVAADLPFPVVLVFLSIAFQVCHISHQQLLKE